MIRLKYLPPRIILLKMKSSWTIVLLRLIELYAKELPPLGECDVQVSHWILTELSGQEAGIHIGVPETAACLS